MALIENIHYLGFSNRGLNGFENMLPLEKGVSYNSFLIKDEKYALIDSVDKSVFPSFFETLIKKLGDRKLDYLILEHVEPDHADHLAQILQTFPDMKIFGTATCLKFINQFNNIKFDDSFHIVNDGDELDLGARKLRFFTAPMVHWPEVMVCYEPNLKLLFSNDAFGSFGAMSGHPFVSKIEFEGFYIDEARRYYSNIVGKYGAQVQSLFKKLSTVEIDMILPSHGPLWRDEMVKIMMEKYQLWSTYTPEEKGILVLYGTMHGNTGSAANLFAHKLASLSDAKIKVYDVSTTHFSHLVAESFKYSHIVFFATTYNAGLFPMMHIAINEMIGANLSNRKYAIFGNGSWAPAASKVMMEMISKMKNMVKIGETIEITSKLRDEQIPQIDQLAEDITADLKL